MRIYAIDHVQLAMPPGGEAQARTFYAGILGLDEIPSLPNWPVAGRVVRQRRCDPPSRRRAGVPARGKAHPALLVEGLAELVTRLVAAGHPIQRDVQLAGIERVHVSDPFGNRIELMERIA